LINKLIDNVLLRKMKKTLLLILLSGVSLCLKAQTLTGTFNGGSLLIENDKGVLKLVLKKPTGADSTIMELPDGSYGSKDIFKGAYNKLISKDNGVDSLGVNDTTTLNVTYKKLRSIYEKSWVNMFKITEKSSKTIATTISPSLDWAFAPTGKSYTMTICVIDNDIPRCAPAVGFENYVSKYEFKSRFDSLTNSLKGKYPNDFTKNKESQLKFIQDTIYANLKNWIGTSGKNSLINVTELKYNDTLKAYLTVRGEIPIYRVLYDTLSPKKRDSLNKISEKSKTDPLMKANYGYKNLDYKTPNRYKNLQTGTVKIVDANIQVEDGFIIGITYNIDPADAVKYSLKLSQASRVRYNLRNIMFAGYFLNEGYPIYFQKEGSTFQSKKDSNKYVYQITDLIDYRSPMNAPNANFTAQETLVNVPKDSLNRPIALKEKSLYAFANLDIYSDLLGLFNQNNPNGLVQTELKIGTALFRRPIFVTYWGNGPKKVLLTPLNKAEIFFRFSKLDDKVKYLDVQRLNNDYQNPPFVHGVNLLQYQSMNYGVRANLLNLDYRGGNTAITGEASVYRTPLRDSVITKDGTTTIKTPTTFGVNSTALSIGISSRIHAATFLDIDFAGRYLYVKPRIDSVKLSNTEYNEFYNNNKFTPASSVKFINYKAMTNIYLNDEKSKRIILRFEYFFDVKQTNNSFSTLQVGYSAYLDKFLNLSPDRSKTK